jgi:hypothetical protein
VSGARIAGIILVILGALALVFGRVSYTEEEASADLGPIDISVRDRETLNIPPWVGVLAIVGGATLLFVPRRRRAA